MFNNGTPQLKYKKRSNIYSNSSGTNTFNPETIEAYSYRWWQYVAKIGKLVIFNNYNYGSTTSGHQCRTKDLLKELGIKIDLVIYSSKGLQNNAWKNEVFEKIHAKLFLIEYRLAKGGIPLKQRKALVKETKDLVKSLAKLRVLKFKLSIKDLKQLKINTIARYEAKLAVNRVKNAEMRAKRKAMVETIKVELDDLSPLNTYDGYDTVNSLEGI